MKKRILTLSISFLILAILLHTTGVLGALFKPNTIRAAGDLIIDFHVPEGDPIFVVENMLPGDFEERNIDVTNGGTIQRMVKMRAVRTGGVGSDPKLESILDIVIKDGAIPIYGLGSPTGSKTVAQFFTDFSNIDGTQLSLINPAESKTYNFEVTFPSSAGNEFQNKSVIFDLIFGDGTEVTPTNTPTPSPTKTPTPTPTLTPTPTPSGNLCDSINVNIFGNGFGSVNGVFIMCINKKVVIQSNTTQVITNTKTKTNTGGNTSTNNTGSTNNTSTSNSSSTVNTTTSSGPNTSN